MKNNEKDKKFYIKSKTVSAHTSETGDDRLNWKYQDKEYNESFKQWRREKRNSVGFYYVENPNRNTYQAGLGFIREYPEELEEAAFRKVLRLLGLCLIFHVSIDIFFRFFLPPMLGFFGADIHYSIFSGERFGNKLLISALDMLECIIGRCLPLIVLVRRLDIPPPVVLPTKVTNRKMFLFSIPAAVFVSGVCIIFERLFEALIGAAGISASPVPMIPEVSGDIPYIFITQVLMVPVISETCSHGAVLQMLRQFGDGTALIISSFIMAATLYDASWFMFTMVVTFVTGYFIMRTGSIVTGIVMHIINACYIFAVCCIDKVPDLGSREMLMRLFLFVTLFASLIAVVYFFFRYSDSFAMTLRHGYMSFSRKVIEMVSCIPFVIWFTLTFMVTALNIKFRM